MKRRTFISLMAVAAAAALTGCGEGENGGASGGGESEQDHLARIQQAGKIVIGMEGNWAPWTYHAESGELTGFDTDVGKAIAEKLGVEAEFQEAPWENLLQGVDSGTFDTIINCVDITEERSAAYTFTDAYCYMRTALVVRSDNTEINGLEDLEGKINTNSAGSSYEILAESYGATNNPVSTLGETMIEVENGRADCTINAELSVLDYMAEHPEAPLKIVAYTDPGEVAIPFRKTADNETLVAAVNEAIAALHADGTLSQLSNSYFGTDITVTG